MLNVVRLDPEGSNHCRLRSHTCIPVLCYLDSLFSLQFRAFLHQQLSWLTGKSRDISTAYQIICHFVQYWSSMCDQIFQSDESTCWITLLAWVWEKEIIAFWCKGRASHHEIYPCLSSKALIQGQAQPFSNLENRLTFQRPFICIRFMMWFI